MIFSTFSSPYARFNFRIGDDRIPVHGPLKRDDVRAAALAKGFDAIAVVVDRSRLIIRCHTCGQHQVKRASVISNNQPECPHCIRNRRIAAAARIGVSFVRHSQKSQRHGHFVLPCGHEIHRQYYRVESAARGDHALGCDICRENRYAAQSLRFGWTLSGAAHSGRQGYRRYRHTCGHGQDIMVGNILWGDCACAGCSPGRTSRPSHIYMFRIHLPGLPVLKLGYSARPAKRLRHQLGIAKTVKTEVIRAIRLPTGHVARSEETQCHTILKRDHPEWLVPKSAYGDAINTVSEIYYPIAEARMHALLDDIDARHAERSA
ncbi:hypothetical protein [Sulfitobacter sp. HGT1]|uniref:hypothetical protein n=1 Tax=unclassified Sulfitobacter TaxID=196795 RepID=UPI001593D2EA|nr:hypothetical protein [Sulfitobacter sp. HGT1]